MRSLRDETRLAGFNVQLFAVSTDDVESVRVFATSLGLKFPLLSDNKAAVARQYGVIGEGDTARRVVFVIDKEGVVRYVSPKVNPATQGPDLVAVLEELKVERR